MAGTVARADPRSVLSWVMAGVGTATALTGAVVSWPYATSCSTPLPIVLALPALGILGLAGLRSEDPRVHWAILGGLIGTSIVGVMSFIWWGLATVVALGAALIIRRSWKPEQWVLTLGVTVLAAGVGFVLLYQATTRIGVDETEPSTFGLLSADSPAFDYSDAFSVMLPRGFSGDIDQLGRLFVQALRPCWSEAISPTELQERTLDTTGNIGAWFVARKRANQVVLGFNRSHIDLRLSLTIHHTQGQIRATATTIARYNNLVGRFYFVPVKFGHRIVLAESMRRLRKYASL